MSIIRIDTNNQRVEFPDDATEVEINEVMGEHEAALIAQRQSSAPLPAQAPLPNAPSDVPVHLQPLTDRERERSGVGQRLVEGLAAGTGATAVAEMIGTQGLKDYINQYQEDRERGMVKQHMGVNVAGGVGQMAGMLVPGSRLAKAAQLAKGAVAAAPTAASRVAAALSGYVGGGAVMGALTPMENEGDSPYSHKAEQILGGAAAGVIMKPVAYAAQAGLGYGKRFAHDLSNSYINKDGAFNAIRETVHNLEPDLARRAALKEGVLARELDPANKDLLVSQAMNLDKELSRRSTGVLDLTKNQAEKSGLQSSKYVAQASELTETPRTLLKNIAGADIQAAEQANSDALKAAFESAKLSPSGVKVRSVVTQIDDAIRGTKSAVPVLTREGREAVDASGQAVLKTGSTVINPTFSSTLSNIRAKLYETYSPQDFSVKLRQLAQAELPQNLGNIQVKGYANQLNAIIDNLPKAGAFGTTESLKALRATIKERGMATDEIGRAVSSVLKMTQAGPTHLTTNAKTLIGIRTQVNDEAKAAASPHEGKILSDLKHTIDKVLGASNSEFKASFAENVAGRAETSRRRVAEALLGETQTSLRQPTPQAYIAAMDNPGFSQSVTKSFTQQPLSTHFSPQEIAVLEKGKRSNLAVSGWNPSIQRPSGDTMASLTADKSSSFLNRELMMVEALKRVGHKNLEPKVQAELWRLENSPKDFAKLFDEVPVTASQKVLRALLENEQVKQFGRAAVPTIAAKQY